MPIHVNHYGLVLALAATLVWGCGCCTSKPTPDPLAGWQGDFSEQPDKLIVDDYQHYIEKLPSEERKCARVSDWRKDATGQHAIVIEVALDGTWWEHVLIYNKDSQRIKIIKYCNGGYRS
jgi:hypothetical protein